MALLKPTTKRLDIPHEPGEWITIRRLPSLGGLNADETAKGGTARLEEYARFFLSAITSWSYPEPPSMDAIAGPKDEQGQRAGGGLDIATSTWLMVEIGKLNRGDGTDAERLAATSPLTEA
jgi:hypothetical protein